MPVNFPRATPSTRFLSRSTLPFALTWRVPPVASKRGTSTMFSRATKLALNSPDFARSTPGIAALKSS
ncbi:hypothetical protein D3C83_207170 [compost metagenome]